MYVKLLDKVIMKNGSIIPSRNERRVRGIKWTASWSNLSLLRGFGPEERSFSWKMIQDMLEVGMRTHRKEAVRECRRINGLGQECGEPDTLNHRILHCNNIKESFRELQTIVGCLLGKYIDEKQMICLSFKHRDRRRLQISLWVVVRTLFEVFSLDKISPTELRNIMIKDI